jgi:thiol-disulfide isomerase/thioredoxin
MATTSPATPLGTPAPTFQLPDPAGRTYSLADVSAGARGTVVVFACNHCPYVQHVAPRLGMLAEEWAAQGVATVAINSNDADTHPDDSPARMAQQGPAWGWTFPYLVDASQEVAKAYGAACTPDPFVFDADLRLVYRGQFDDTRPGGAEATGADLDAAVRAVVAGQAPAADQHPAVGCSIKWR